MLQFWICSHNALYMLLYRLKRPKAISGWGGYGYGRKAPLQRAPLCGANNNYTNMRLYLLWWYDDVFYDGPILRWAGWDGPIIGGFCSFWRNRHRLIALHCCTILTIFRTVHNVSFVQLYICVDTLVHNKLSQFCRSINSYYRAIEDAPVSVDFRLPQ